MNQDNMSEATIYRGQPSPRIRRHSHEWSGLDAWLLVKEFSKPLGQPSLSTTHRMCICTFAHTYHSFPPPYFCKGSMIINDCVLELNSQHTCVRKDSGLYYMIVSHGFHYSCPMASTTFTRFINVFCTCVFIFNCSM